MRARAREPELRERACQAGCLMYYNMWDNVGEREREREREGGRGKIRIREVRGRRTVGIYTG